MIREDLRSRRIAVIADFVVNPGSALYGKRQAPPSGFMDALVERGWGIMKMPPHVAKLESCERLIEVSVGDLIDYRKNGYDVVIAAVGDSRTDLLRAACAVIWSSGRAIYGLHVPEELYAE